MHLQTGSETMNINRQFLLKTDSGKENSSTKNYVYQKPGVRVESMYNKTFVVKECAFDCIWKKMAIKVTVKTKARTPFFLSGPEFGLFIPLLRVQLKAGLMQPLQQDLNKCLLQV